MLQQRPGIPGAPLAFESALGSRRIFVTGHTGFTGGWACAWLLRIGADVAGYALRPDTQPNLFEALGLEARMKSTFGDLCDPEGLHRAIADFQPELILHLAAQPLVRRSYREPARTFDVNVGGTSNVLDAARHVNSVRGVLCITTDKVYRNQEWAWPYRESDPLGGRDPYSASKSAAEMVIQSYAASYPPPEGPYVATARGGNIVGGGDWSEDRLVPDFVRSVVSGNPLPVRYPNATRPWQHVLALVHGYLLLLAGLVSEEPAPFAQPWNLGPSESRAYSVTQVLEILSANWTRPEIRYEDAKVHEAAVLALDSTLARSRLGWNPPWDTQRVLAETAAWYQAYYRDPGSAARTTEAQIESWRTALS